MVVSEIDGRFLYGGDCGPAPRATVLCIVRRMRLSYRFLQLSLPLPILPPSRMEPYPLFSLPFVDGRDAFLHHTLVGVECEVFRHYHLHPSLCLSSAVRNVSRSCSLRLSAIHDGGDNRRFSSFWCKVTARGHGYRDDSSRLHSSSPAPLSSGHQRAAKRR